MPNNNPDTLEAAREMLLQNSETISTLTSEKETLQTEKATLEKEIEELRTLNQRLFLRASQGSEPEPQPEQPSESLEDFARKLKGVL